MVMGCLPGDGEKDDHIIGNMMDMFDAKGGCIKEKKPKEPIKTSGRCLTNYPVTL